MKTRLCLLLLLCTLPACRSSAAVPGINIIMNGDFESFTDGGYGVPPWEFDAGYSAYINEPAQTASGGVCVFVGNLMWQDLATEYGQHYLLSYYERGDMPGQSERESTLNVFWGSQLVATHVENNVIRGWNLNQVSVMSFGPRTRLTFERAPGSYGLPGVDWVRVITVPEPSTMGMVAIALGAFVIPRLRSRAI